MCGSNAEQPIGRETGGVMSRCGQATTLLVQVSTYPETNLETSAAIVSSARGREVNRRLAWAVVCVGHLDE